MKAKAIHVQYRALQNIRNAFMKVTHVSSWQEAQERYPNHTTEKRLSQFLGLNFIKNVPDTFRTFCKSATTSREEPNGGNAIKVYEDVVAAVVEMDFSQLEETAIKTVYPTYSGAGLILMNIPVVSS